MSDDEQDPQSFFEGCNILPLLSEIASLYHRIEAQYSDLITLDLSPEVKKAHIVILNDLYWKYSIKVHTLWDTKYKKQIYKITNLEK